MELLPRTRRAPPSQELAVAPRPPRPFFVLLSLSAVALERAEALATFAARQQQRGGEVEVGWAHLATLHRQEEHYSDEEAWPFWHEGTGKNDTSLRDQYMKEKLQIERAAIAGINADAAWRLPAPEAVSRNKKVAFLFMLMDTLNWEIIWAKFFSGRENNNKYSVYVHRALVKDDAARKSPLALARFGAQAVPWVNSSWCALVGVEVAMLRASLADPHNAQFVFISQDTVPLKNFAYVYESLISRSSGTSKFCFAEPARHKYAAVEQLSNQALTRCCFRDYYSPINSTVKKHHQWVVLARPHALTIATRALEGLEVWSDIWKLAAPDITTMAEGCSDESVPITTLLLEAKEKESGIRGDDSVHGEGESSTSDRLAEIGVEEKCLTFVNWYNCFRNTEFMLEGWGLTKAIKEHSKDLWRYLFDKDFDFVHDTKLNGFPTVYDQVDVKYLVGLTQTGFMFGRKFPVNISLSVNGTDTNASFARVLPQLWELIQPERSLAMTWPRLQSEYKPSSAHG